MCTRNRESGSNNTSRGNRGGGGRAERKDSAMKTIREFERSWPLMPATGGVGSDAIRVLLELHQHMPVVSPLAEGTRASPMSDDMKKVSFEMRRDASELEVVAGLATLAS